MKLKKLDGNFIIIKDVNFEFTDNTFCIIKEADGYTMIKTLLNTEENFSEYFKAFYIDELYNFETSGILFKIIEPLKNAKISVLVVSAFSRDYIFVLEKNYETAIKILGI
ncbi:ACT domain-containing protein [Campylobacter geochelonis]|uniref:Uncharacterized conserved protein n=1 Tax=Campylobacter geochelonis TaxID=1780362 RepID=A0A128EKK5_9BACT|nr:ACT domain-containing protein [Campylobacter geochelonis]QKF71391.1 ACT domain-containing protein [Campylobacter geochelonis]CZE49485.1 Uncharacterized conserved protein [Campylobacter geochelonis]